MFRRLRHLHGPFQSQPLHLQAVVLDFDVIVVTKEVVIPGGDGQGLFHVGLSAGQQRAIEFAGDAAAQADQPVAMGGQQFLVDPRLEVEAFQKRGGGELHEVAKAGVVAGQQREVMAGFLRSAQFFAETAAGSDVGFDSEDRIDAELLGRSDRTSPPRGDCRGR